MLGLYNLRHRYLHPNLDVEQKHFYYMYGMYVSPHTDPCHGYTEKYKTLKQVHLDKQRVLKKKTRKI
jgi:hypothetical protein